TITLKTAPAPLDPDPSGVDPDRHPKLRRWDQSGAGASATGVAITGAWQALEDGVEVQLADANYRTGDYWVVPARTATGELEWPPFAIPNASPQAQPRRGIHHHFCRLALLELDATSKAWTVAEDCRQVFAPLTEPCCGKSTTALHVVDTNWTNDDSFPPAQAAKEGLRIRLDSAADPASLTNDTVQVAVEAPTVLKGADASVFVHRVYVRGVVERDAKDPAIVVWRPAFDGFEKAVDGFRARVKLVGSCIWGDGEGTARHLDGRTLGKSEPPGGPPPARIALVFPSGGGGDASDFDSWFTFGAATHAPPKTFQAIAIKLTSAQNAPSSAGTVQLPLAPGAKVAFKAGEQIRFLDIAFNRDVEPKSVPAAPLTSVFVDQIAAAGAPKRLVVDLQVAGASVRVTLRDPSFFSPGNYVLTCIGTAPTAAIAALPVVRSKGDAAALDGDFDDKDGGNLTVPFTVT
ncbi:MAG TPA: DUF6519 domain-containing protein, partial [Planctomycetota bacterium]|nr:DUF6519 domain-containing protein [Planctomycetota bacterium]